LFFIYAKQKVNEKRIIFRQYIYWISITLGILFIWQQVLNLFTVELHGIGSISARWGIMTRGADLFVQNLLFGIGWGRFESAVGRGAHSHWLKTATELGIPGLLTEALVWFLFFRLAFSALRTAKKLLETELVTILLGWTSLMFAFCLWQGFENIGLLGGTRVYYICFGFITACYTSLKIKESKAEQRARKKTMTGYSSHSFHPRYQGHDGIS